MSDKIPAPPSGRPITIVGPNMTNFPRTARGRFPDTMQGKEDSIYHCMMLSNTDLSVLPLSQVAIELVKVVMKSPAEDFKNCFMNLALPYVIFSEPGPPEVTVIRSAQYLRRYFPLYLYLLCMII